MIPCDRKTFVAAVVVMGALFIIAEKHAQCNAAAEGRTFPPYSVRAGFASRSRHEEKKAPPPPQPDTPYQAHRTLEAPGARLIIIGDVHGMHTELEALLRNVNHNATKDTLVLTGDVAGKGPDGEKVVQTVRRVGGISVRGNHDFYFKGRGSAFVAAFPYTLHVVRFGVLVVHAGVLPGVPLASHPLDAMLTMRNIAGNLTQPEALNSTDQGVPWAARLEEWAARIGAETPHIVFGHDAKRGLQLRNFSTGLDSGCVYGGRLTAMVFSGEGGGVGKERIKVSLSSLATSATPELISVPCRRAVDVRQ